MEKSNKEHIEEIAIKEFKRAFKEMSDEPFNAYWYNEDSNSLEVSLNGVLEYIFDQVRGVDITKLINDYLEENNFTSSYGIYSLKLIKIDPRVDRDYSAKASIGFKGEHTQSSFFRSLENYYRDTIERDLSKFIEGDHFISKKFNINYYTQLDKFIREFGIKKARNEFKIEDLSGKKN